MTLLSVKKLSFYQNGILKNECTKIKPKEVTVENLISCHFEFRGRFWRDLKGSGVCFSN